MNAAPLSSPPERHSTDCNQETSRRCKLSPPPPPPPPPPLPAAMAFLFRKFHEAVKVLAKSPKFARDPRHAQFEADVNRLFLYTSYNRLGKNAEEKDADEIIEMGNKASVADQQKQVQENIHFQVGNICKSFDEILHPEVTGTPVSQLQSGARRSGLSYAVGSTLPSTKQPVIPETRPLTLPELSQSLKDHIGYTLEIKPSQIPHKDAGLGLFLTGEADVGAIVAFYPGVIYSPAYYQHIPGYPRVDAHNSYLITRYDGTVINAQPWGIGGCTREVWDGCFDHEPTPSFSDDTEGSDKLWKFLSKPSRSSLKVSSGEVIERRNPLAFGHFANHPEKGATPNVMVCPYDFPVTEEMRAYIPNLVFGGNESVTMKRFGSFWFRSRGSGDDEEGDGLVIKTIVLVAMRGLSDEEVFLNYRLSNTKNSKRKPAWYAPVDEEEDRRRWS